MRKLSIFLLSLFVCSQAVVTPVMGMDQRFQGDVEISICEREGSFKDLMPVQWNRRIETFTQMLQAGNGGALYVIFPFCDDCTITMLVLAVGQRFYNGLNNYKEKNIQEFKERMFKLDGFRQIVLCGHKEELPRLMESFYRAKESVLHRKQVGREDLLPEVEAKFELCFQHAKFYIQFCKDMYKASDFLKKLSEYYSECYEDDKKTLLLMNSHFVDITLRDLVSRFCSNIRNKHSFEFVDDKEKCIRHFLICKLGTLGALRNSANERKTVWMGKFPLNDEVAIEMVERIKNVDNEIGNLRLSVNETDLPEFSMNQDLQLFNKFSKKALCLVILSSGFVLVVGTIVGIFSIQ